MGPGRGDDVIYMLGGLWEMHFWWGKTSFTIFEFYRTLASEKPSSEKPTSEKPSSSGIWQGFDWFLEDFVKTLINFKIISYWFVRFLIDFYKAW